MMFALAARDDYGRTVYLALEADGSPVCDPRIDEAATWEDVAEMLRWADGLSEATLTRIAARPGLRLIEVDGPSLEPGVTPSALSASIDFINSEKWHRTPKSKRKVLA